MMLEHALLTITPGREGEFVSSMKVALDVIEAAPGCHGAEVRRQAEDGSVFLLLVRWESIDAHMGFRETELFERWRSLTHPFYVSAPSVTHFHEPLER